MRALLAEIKTLNTPALDRRAVEAWNDLVSSDRARRLPRASLVREAKRLVETGSIDKGRCPLCGQTVDHKTLVRRIESALVEMMEASRDLERFRDPIAQQADDLGAAHDKTASPFTIARAPWTLELPPVPDIPHASLRRSVDALAPVDDRRDHGRSVRAAQVGPGSWHDRSERRRPPDPAHATRSSSCWPLCASR